MDVLVDDLRTSEPRLIQCTWMGRGASDVPPESWLRTVLGEVQVQRTEELKARTGRKLPFE
jgi:hypothetical protein